MNILDVITAIENAEGANRKLDAVIAKIVGWEKTIKQRPADKNGNVVSIAVWRDPEGQRAKKIPFYTESAHTAWELIKRYSGGRAGAVTFGPHGSTAQVDGMEPASAKTMALAMCIAALKLAIEAGASATEDIK